MLLIEDEEPTLEDLGVLDEDQLLIEVRNKDLTWPEEMGSLAIPMQDKRKQGKWSRSQWRRFCEKILLKHNHLAQ
jgi:ubiquitin carboxyl-terminal hydrolase 6/32